MFLRNFYVLQAVVFYVLAIVAVMVASAVPRTADARGPLVGAILIAFAVELALISQQSRGVSVSTSWLARFNVITGEGHATAAVKSGSWLSRVVIFFVHFIAHAFGVAFAMVISITAFAMRCVASFLLDVARAALPLAVVVAVLDARVFAVSHASSFAAAWCADHLEDARLVEAHWAVRWTLITVCAIVLVYTYVRYVNDAAAVHALLADVAKRLSSTPVPPAAASSPPTVIAAASAIPPTIPTITPAAAATMSPLSQSGMNMLAGLASVFFPPAPIADPDSE